jgi:2-oxo-4-hydroxy-4-carboxy--5-ureidoimidazoline (OHCU) decarboxylase
MKNRVKNNYQEEFSTAINEVHKIAKIRLDALEL